MFLTFQLRDAKAGIDMAKVALAIRRCDVGNAKRLVDPLASDYWSVVSGGQTGTVMRRSKSSSGSGGILRLPRASE